MDTVDANIELGHLADEREYSIAGLILENLQVNSVELITNNPKKIAALEKLGVAVEKRIPVEVIAHHDNIDYLKTKAKKMAHLLFQPKNKKT
jgi:3,4-dihydroxy 2-butanone 4-phosphate synthase/GTP cyclohydrolase II